MDSARIALDRLYREHKHHVFNYLSRLTRDRELAQDVTQQTFLKAFADPNIHALESPKAYLFTIARNTLYDEWKRKKEALLADGDDERALEMADDPMETPHEQAAALDLRGKVEAAIGLMRPKFRELMLLRYGEDLSIEEIAAVTGRGVSDVKVNLHRARLAFDKDFTALMYSRVAGARGKCEQIARLLAPYEDRELPEGRIQIVNDHLDTCALCADDAEQMKKRRELFVAIPLIPAPLALDRAIEESLVGQAAKTVSTTGNTVTATATKAIVAQSLALKIAAVTAIAVAVGTAGYWFIGRQVMPPAPSPETAVTTEIATVESGKAVPAAPADAAEPSAGEPGPAAPARRERKPGEPRPWWMWDGPPLSAEVVRKDTFDGGSETRDTQYLSRAGARQETDMPGMGKLISIVNSKFGKVWMLDPQRRVYLEDELDAAGKLKKYEHIFGEDTGNRPADGVTSDTVLDDVPCHGYDQKAPRGEETVSGRKTLVWHCRHSTALVSLTQWYDPEWKIVLRDRSGSHTSELRNLKLGEQPPSLFELPAGYRKVEPSQFLPNMPVADVDRRERRP